MLWWCSGLSAFTESIDAPLLPKLAVFSEYSKTLNVQGLVGCNVFPSFGMCLSMLNMVHCGEVWEAKTTFCQFHLRNAGSVNGGYSAISSTLLRSR